MSFVSIGYGVRWERYYTAWMSVIMNLIFTALFLGSNDLPIIICFILALYVILGVAVAYKGKRMLYSLFGTKTFGALTLTASLNAVNLLGWASSISDRILGYDDSTIMFLISWIIIGLIVHFFGWILFGRRRR
jgi:phosphoglycerol transferase MdoB-like AlkP superfamily enzyme